MLTRIVAVLSLVAENADLIINNPVDTLHVVIVYHAAVSSLGAGVGRCGESDGFFATLQFFLASRQKKSTCEEQEK